MFHEATDIAVDRWHNTYIADPREGRVKKFGPRGHLAASWGTDAPGPLHWSPRGVAVDGQGNAYVLAGGITKLAPGGRVLARWTKGSLGHAAGIAVGGSGNLFVLSAEASTVPHRSTPAFDARVDKLSPQGAMLSTWRTPPQQLADFSPNGIAVDPQGNVFVSAATTQGCSPPCPPTTVFLYRFSSAGKLFSAPHSPDVPLGPVSAVDAQGNIYMTYDGTNSGILKLSPAGLVLGKWGKYGCGPGQYGDVLRAALDTRGLLYVADSHVAEVPAYAASGVIHVLSPNGTSLAQFGTALSCTQRAFPLGTALTVDRAGTLYFAGNGGYLYATLSADGRMVRRFGGTGSGSTLAYDVQAMAVDARGNVYITDDIGRQVDKFSPSGRLIARWRVLGPDDGLLQGLALDRWGNIYVSASAQGRVLKLSPHGTVLASLGRRGSGPGQLLGPNGLAVDWHGNVYVADTFNNRIQKLSPSGQPLAAWGTPQQGSTPSQFDRPTTVKLDSHGNLFVLDSFRNRIVELSPTGRQLAVWGGSGIEPGRLSEPSDLAVGGRGNLYILDAGNNRIQKLIRAA